MAPDAERLIAEALKLKVEERADLVDRLLRTLDEEESGELDAEDRIRLNAALDSIGAAIQRRPYRACARSCRQTAQTQAVNRYRVVFSEQAVKHVEAIDTWWRLNRASAPDAFADELAASVRRLRRYPDVARQYTVRYGRVIKRILLPRSRHHIFYTIDERHIYAVWHASRGAGPDLD